MTVSLASLIRAIPMTPTVDMSQHFSGGRLWTGFDHEGESIWLADLARMTPGNLFSIATKRAIGIDVLQNNLFISADRKTFHQLRNFERAPNVVTTDTPDLLPLMFVYGERDARLLYDKPQYRGSLRMVEMGMRREPVGDAFLQGAFLAFRE